MKPGIPQDKIFPYFKQIFADTGEPYPLPDDLSGFGRNKTYEAPGGGSVMRPIVEGLTEPQLFDIAIDNFGNLISDQLEPQIGDTLYEKI